MEDVGPKKQDDCKSWYWFMALTAIIIIVVITIYGVSQIELDDIVAWLAVMLLFGSTITMEVAPANSKARTIAKFFSLALIMVLVVMFCAKLKEYFPLPVMFIAWFMIVVNFAAAWYDFFLR